MQLLADGLVEREIVESISSETVRRTLKKTDSSPGWKECWCLPPQGSAEFVCAMEDVLEVYHRDYGEGEVLVCLDETSKQLVAETRQPRPAIPGHPLAYDHEYRRNGVSNLFMMLRPPGRVATGGGHGAEDQGGLGRRWCGNWWTRTFPIRNG